MLCLTLFVVRSIFTSLGPPLTTASVLGEAGVEHPQRVLIIYDDALHTTPTLIGRTILVVPGVVREWPGLSFYYFSHGDGVVIRPKREVDEHSALGGNSHSSHLLGGKGGHFFQLNLFRSDCRGQKNDCTGGRSKINKPIMSMS